MANERSNPLRAVPPVANGAAVERTAAPLGRSMAPRSDKVAVSVAREIVRDIAGLERGAMLPSESSMLDSYAVSRGSLREALRILEVQGLITIKPGPGGGPVLVGPESASLGKTQTLFFHLLGARYCDLLNAQAVLEPTIARLAATNSDRSRMTLVQHFVDIDLVGSDDPKLYHSFALGFHSTLIAACGNPILTLLAQSVRDITLSKIDGQVFSADGERQEIIDAHSRIAKAVLTGNGALAEALMADHMHIYCERIMTRKAGLVDEVVDWQ